MVTHRPPLSSLVTVKRVLRKFKNPHLNYPYIHVTGSNGKGTTSKLLAHLLAKHSTLKIGLFTSPHLHEVTERISVDNEEITMERLDSIIEQIHKVESDLSYFERLTIAALIYFSTIKVDLAIIEVGLEGEFDSTNVFLSNCIACVICTVALDHTRLLGGSELKIAEGLSYIIRPNCNVVLQEQENRAVEEHIAERVERLCGKLFLVKAPHDHYALTNKSLGRNINVETAILTFNKILLARFSLSLLKNDALLRSLESFRNPGRFDIRELSLQEKKIRVILDIAHNPNSLKYLLRNLESLKLHSVYFFISIKKEKDVVGFIDSIFNIGLDVSVMLTAVSHNFHFSHQLIDRYSEQINFLAIRDREAALKTAIRSAIKNGKILVATGSFVLVDFVSNSLKTLEASENKEDIRELIN